MSKAKFKESETLELKKSTSELKEAIISIVAILNKHQAGELYFGLRNDGMVVGQTIGKDTIRDISRVVSNSIEPKIYPSIQYIKLENKDSIKVEFKGKEIPYYAFGRPYIRVGDEDRKLSAKELESIILEKNKDKLRWDKNICVDAKINDISVEKLKTFLKLAGLKYDSVENTLKKLKLISSNKLFNTAIIMFGKKPQDFFHNAKLRCAVFATTDTVTPIDMKDFEGDLFYLIQRAEEYILEHINIGMRLEGLRRIDVPEIDKEAFREAIINAFCHRDYWDYDSVNIAIFKDRLEVRSPGLLYGGLTIERIKKEMVSERRNELIAELFHEIHFVEKWGRGIKLILEKEPTSDFKEVGTHFITVFKRRKIVKGANDLGSQKTHRKHTEKAQKIIDEIIRDPKISRKELSEKTGLGISSVIHHLRTLQKNKHIRRIGPDKGGHWEVVK